MSKSARSSLKLTFMTSLSRILGLIRDHLLARFFGTSIYATYWEIAYMFPNMLRNLLAEGVLSQSFIPLYSSSLKESQEKAKEDFGYVLMFLAIFLGGIVVSGILLFPVILPFYVGKPAGEISLLILLAQIVFPFIFFVSLSSVYAGVLNTHENYVVPSLSPILLNIDFIITLLAIMLISQFFSVSLEATLILLGVMVVLGGAGVLFLHVYFVGRNHWSPHFYFTPDFWKKPAVKKLLTIVLPAILGQSIFQLNQLMDIFLASYFVKIDGAIPALRFAHRLIQLPTGLIGVAIATTILPAISLFIRNRETGETIGKELTSSLRFAFFLTIPAALGLFLLGPWIVHFLFSGGLWDLRSTYITLWSLQFYALGIPFYSANKILTSAYYSFQDTKTPVRFLIVAVSVNFLLNIALIPVLEHGGLALSTSLSAALHFFLLLRGLRKKPVKIDGSQFSGFWKRMVIPLLLMVLFLVIINTAFRFPYEEHRFSLSFLSQFPEEPEELPSRWKTLFVITAGVAGSIVLYLASSRFVLEQESKILFSFLERRNRKTRS